MANDPAMLGYAKKDKWVGAFVKHAGGCMATIEEIHANTTVPMAFSGISKSSVKEQAEKYGLDYWYIDTGYLGNRLFKNWFRITKNGYQVTVPIRNKPNDRLTKLRINRVQIHRGSKIMIVPVDDKVAGAYGLVNSDVWLHQTIDKIKKYTDRDIVIRTRPASRETRVTTDTFVDSLHNDINAVVTWTSNCGVESIQHGIPVVSLGPCATTQVSGKITQIDNLPSVDPDLTEAWLRWLSYNQFTQMEINTGLAWNILQENYERTN